MQTAQLCRIASPITGLARLPQRPSGAVFRTRYNSIKATAAGKEHNKQSLDTPVAALALLSSSLPLVALPALADDATDAIATSSGPSIFGFTPLGLFLAFSPLFIYGGFYAYRQYVNPRANISDLVFGIAAFLIVGNIFSIIVFKQKILPF